MTTINRSNPGAALAPFWTRLANASLRDLAAELLHRAAVEQQEGGDDRAKRLRLAAAQLEAAMSGS